MPRFLAVLAAASAALALGAGSGAAATQCPAASIGPGSISHGGTAGARCLLAAFDDRCRAADYTLSSFGVDTIHSEEFQLAHRAGRCLVLVTDSHRVVPQPAHVTGHATCLRIRKTSSDIVADRCTPARTISLTKLGVT
jgi:hypothetical protein